MKLDLKLKHLIDAYINANRALFNTQKDFVQDLNAAKILKGDMKEIGRYVSGKVGKKKFHAVDGILSDEEAAESLRFEKRCKNENN